MHKFKMLPWCIFQVSGYRWISCALFILSVIFSESAESARKLSEKNVFGSVVPLSTLQPAQSCSGSCLNPHPGEFRSWNGEQRQCWLQVWRQWPEGCTHFQWYNTCNGTWDVDEYGNPRINWTCCVH